MDSEQLTLSGLQRRMLALWLRGTEALMVQQLEQFGQSKPKPTKREEKKTA